METILIELRRAFSPAAIAKSPVPGYRPGQGNAADSSTFLNWYLTSLNDYGVWLANAFRSAFGSGPRLQILLPSWGIRPGEKAPNVGQRVVEHFVRRRIDGDSILQIATERSQIRNLVEHRHTDLEVVVAIHLAA